MTKLAALLLLASTGCIVRTHRHCREHETWNGSACYADRGYEHYWDHPDHRDWHPPPEQVRDHR